jgi:hypothetical protein
LAPLYPGCDDGVEIAVKLLRQFDAGKICEIGREIERLMNLIYSRIAITLGFLLPKALKELKIARSNTRSDSVKDGFSARPF